MGQAIWHGFPDIMHIKKIIAYSLPVLPIGEIDNMV